MKKTDTKTYEEIERERIDEMMLEAWKMSASLMEKQLKNCHPREAIANVVTAYLCLVMGVHPGITATETWGRLEPAEDAIDAGLQAAIELLIDQRDSERGQELAAYWRRKH